ncbi:MULTISPECIES: proline racemase family protein [unclassified Ruegeria]|uniref:4-hydroxyproline epimerase n=1 Tax=unclassified Ruegeria TaxID=2625375 RepID=UPI001487729C|nr:MULTISPECIES: proline racemase family protein [unclassified Ruegeria]NOD34559.1 hydroxyproline-2-epimerase [Ruegeria sp. HKCCD7296]NOE35737.1 hydroxyproline-2-epimerase [Ruegeria sp. HKCCD7318]NOE40217.1 hydroxyproline-2-epimerase [Ruegeria sp. HKCCD7319]
MHVIDSHTGGMPTRVILDGGPDLGSGPLAERARLLATEHEAFYKSVLLEPRGQPGMVGALLVPPEDPNCETGVIYFDADAVLGMCGHGTIGLGVTLAHLGRITPGTHRIETPAGLISVELLDANTVRVTNIESRRVRASVSIEVEGHGQVTGDLAYGGNWFFIVDPSPIAVETGNIRALTDLTIAIREACIAQGVTGENGEDVDHVILQGKSPSQGIHSRNFVLCPDDEYDRSPCGTGSSARLACLAADGVLAPGEEIIQESVIGSPYRLSYQPGPNGGVIPTLTGQAHVMAEGKLIFAQNDPFCAGIYL